MAGKLEFPILTILLGVLLLLVQVLPVPDVPRNTDDVPAGKESSNPK